MHIFLFLCIPLHSNSPFFSILFGCNSPGNAGSAVATATATSEKVVGTVSGMHDIQTVFGSTGSKWTQISRTEVCVWMCKCVNEWISCCNCYFDDGLCFIVFALIGLLNGWPSKIVLLFSSIRVIIANKCNETDTYPLFVFFSSSFFSCVRWRTSRCMVRITLVTTVSISASCR